MKDAIARQLEASAAVQRELAEKHLDTIAAMAEVLIAVAKGGGCLYLCGNGGSAADCQHIAGEFVGRFLRERRALPAVALTTDTSILTAIGNDYGFEQVFARQLVGKARAGDVFLGITTSGQSPNILRALQECPRLGVLGIVFSGRGGGPAREHAAHCIAVPGSATSTIQEQHIVLAHTLCECVESALFDQPHTSRSAVAPASALA
jgi:D-sedoheptulose 7-phosphate isomerase